MPTLVELTPQADSMTESYSHADSRAECRILSVRIHPSIKRLTLLRQDSSMCKISRIGKLKVVRGDRLFETKSSLTPSSLSETESSPTRLCPNLHLAETVSDPSLSRPDQISPIQEQVDNLHLAFFSSTDPLHELDPEIEIILRRLRKVRNIVVSNSNSSNSVSSCHNSSLVTKNSDSLKYSSTNNFAKLEQIENNDQTLKELTMQDVVYQPWCIQYPQLEPAQTYKLKFREDPHKYLKEFHVVCSTMRPQGIPKYYIKMKAFPFSLDGATKDWLYLQPVLFNTWGDMKRMFLKKFFLASQAATIRKKICGTRQHSGQTLHEYWERFNKLCATCLHHQISEQLLIQYFYEGLTMVDRSMIDITSGRALMDKTPAATKHLISNMTIWIKGVGQPWMVNEIDIVDNLRLENQLTELTSLVRQLVVGQHQPSIAVRICPECDSSSKWLSTIEFAIPRALVPTTTITKNATSRQLTISRRPNEVVSNNKSKVPTKHERHHLRPQDENWTASKHCKPFTVNWVRQPTLTNNSKFEGNASVVSLRSESRPTATDFEPDADPQKVEINIPLLDAIKQIPKYAKFLKDLCVHKRKKMRGGVELGGIVSGLTRNEEFIARAQQALPKKCRDPKIFSVPCTIGDYTFVDAMLDLGASINVMPTSIYKSLNFGDLEPTGMTIQLANRSVVQTLGVLEYVLVQVNELIFPTGFYVLDMEDKTSGKGSTLILG
ncbi:hypothetical protein CR513_00715, partial [Mucuna pruriens]